MAAVYNSCMPEVIRLEEMELQDAVWTCAEVLERGGLAAVPTDTVYGLAARPDMREAVGRIFKVKGRDAQKALVVMVSSLDEAVELAAPEEREGLRRLGSLWPGALTIVTRIAPIDWLENVAPFGTVGIRIPAATFLLELLRQTGPLAVTSANLSGAGAPGSFDEVNPDLLEKLDMVVDGGGDCGSGKPSTVAEIGESGLRILRVGQIGEAELRLAMAGAESQ